MKLHILTCRHKIYLYTTTGRKVPTQELNHIILFTVNRIANTITLEFPLRLSYNIYIIFYQFFGGIIVLVTAFSCNVSYHRFEGKSYEHKRWKDSKITVIIIYYVYIDIQMSVVMEFSSWKTPHVPDEMCVLPNHQQILKWMFISDSRSTHNYESPCLHIILIFTRWVDQKGCLFTFFLFS